MQTLFEFAPLAAFGIAWALYDVYVATAVLMVGMFLLVAWDWLRTRTIPPMHLVSAVLVWIFGATTLILHDVRFIQWKATVFYWLVAAVLAGSIWIGHTTLLERLVRKAAPGNLAVAAATWRNLSLLSALFYVAMGVANIWIAYHMSERAWVMFKSWIAAPLLFVFNAGVLFWLLRDYEEPAREST